MKTKKTTIRVFSVLFLFITSLLNCGLQAQDIFVEKESIVIVEVESASINVGWLEGNTTVNAEEIKYYTSKADYFNTPNQYTLTYKIQINNPGTYRFQWHCKVGEGTSTTDFNDSWLKLPDANDFYAKNTSNHIVRPRGVCTTDCPNGAGSAGWFKSYSNGTVNWSWSTRTSDNDPHDIFARFDAAGVYTILISARSKNHFLNRFVLYNPTKYTESQATDLTLAESEKLGANSILEQKTKDWEVFPNPAFTHLTLSANSHNLESYEIINFSGQTILNGQINQGIQKVDISSLCNGMYILKCSNADNFSNSIKFSKQN